LGPVLDTHLNAWKKTGSYVWVRILTSQKSKFKDDDLGWSSVGLTAKLKPLVNCVKIDYRLTALFCDFVSQDKNVIWKALIELIGWHSCLDNLATSGLAREIM